MGEMNYYKGVNGMPESRKVLLSAVVAVIVWFALPPAGWHVLPRIMLCWDVLALVLLLLNWITFFTADPHDIRNLAKMEDSSRFVVFCVVLVCTFASLAAVVLLLLGRSQKAEWKGAYMAVAVAGMVFSWFMVHTIYTIRYAHKYYANHPQNKEIHAGGLDFPNDDKPDFIDFAYFAFVLGMTFQVSDVQITSKRLRRLALTHGMLSFGYNTIIVALTINLLASQN